MSKRQINYENDKNITANRLKEAMEEAKISLTELAEKSKVSKSSISQYTHAIQSPSNISAMAMAKVLDVSPVWLMGFDAPKNREQFINSKDSTNFRLSVYNEFAQTYSRIATAYNNLPDEGKKEFDSYLEYLTSKYKK